MCLRIIYVFLRNFSDPPAKGFVNAAHYARFAYFILTLPRDRESLSVPVGSRFLAIKRSCIRPSSLRWHSHNYACYSYAPQRHCALNMIHN